jgi:membrane protein implicated in regulation of membrane protease activity
MLIIGLLLVIAASAITVGAVYDGSEAATVELAGWSLDTTVAGVFFTGMGTALVFLLGLWLALASLGRARRKRAERKEQKRRTRSSVARLEEERTTLRAENEKLSERVSADQPPRQAAADGEGRSVGDQPGLETTRDPGYVPAGAHSSDLQDPVARPVDAAPAGRGLSTDPGADPQNRTVPDPVPGPGDDGGTGPARHRSSG